MINPIVTTWNLKNRSVRNSVINHCIIGTDFGEKINTLGLNFILKLSSHSHMTEKQIFEIITETSCLFKVMFETLEVFHPYVNTDVKSTYKRVLEKYSNPFKNFATPLKLNTYLHEVDFIREPKKFIVDQSVALVNDTLKPKHHLMTHYGSIIRYSGPLKFIWCMRFEPKNKEMKGYTNATVSRRNLPYSLAKKCCLKFAYLLS